MTIQDYLEKMEKFRSKEVNKDKCTKHKKPFVSYCFDCNSNLCENCLRDRIHFFHNKNNNIEIQPIKEELEIIEQIKKKYEKKIEMGNNKKIHYNYYLKKENLKKKEKIKTIKNEKKNELKKIQEEYKSEIFEINKKFENEKKLKLNELKIKEMKIINKYKLINEKENKIHKFKKKLIEKKSLEEKNKINNLNNIKRLTDIIYNTYNSYSNNYYNILNINNIILSFSKNEKIKNEIMKKIIKNNLDEKLKDNEIITFENKQRIENNKKIKEEKLIEFKVREIKKKLDLEFKTKLNEIIKKNEEKNKEKIEQIELNYRNKIIKINLEKEEINEKYIKYKKEVEEKFNKINNQIIILYKINRNKNFIRIFGNEFVKNNKNICKLILYDKEQELQERINIQNLDDKNEILTIKLNDIQNITNLKGMFCDCSELLYILDFSKLNTSKVTDMSYLFNGCRLLESLSDISNWDTSNVTDINNIFNG